MYIYKKHKNIDHQNFFVHITHIRIKISVNSYINNEYTFNKKIHVSTALGDTIALTSV